jgi:hypothetical protein
MGADRVGVYAALTRVAAACLFLAAAMPTPAGAAPRSGRNPSNDGLAGIARETVEDAQAPADGANPSQTYRIQLTRVMRPGQRYAYSADATVVDSATGKLSGSTKTLKPRTVSVHFEGEMEVLAVNVYGEPTKARFLVHECSARAMKDRITVFKRGTVVTAEATKYKTKLSPDRGGLSIEEDMMARSVLSLPKEDGITDDDLFGTRARQKVGGAWAVNPDKLVKSFAAQGSRVQRNNVSGTVRLKGVEYVDGIPCLRINGRAQIAEFTVPQEDVPDGTRVKQARSEIKFTRLSPIDPSKYSVLDSYSTTTYLTLVTDEGVISPDMTVEARWLRTVGATYRLLDDGVQSVASP